MAMLSEQIGAALLQGAPGRPMNLEELTGFVAQTAALFYLVEEPHNPGVQSYWDALHYVATSLSVGYANIFPVTPIGKAIGAAVQMVGPALSAKALEREEAQVPASDPQLLDRLDAVLAELRALREGAEARGPGPVGPALPR
jgi:hypothetical protein